ncbi:hypothetical protein Syun_004282 [Stephania yunnanensis]|uniref:Uncharacterized protein n=1 Tax=Stephania yunnanensis TaxID=152371 RepID=A0AAP0L596_9MAGN
MFGEYIKGNVGGLPVDRGIGVEGKIDVSTLFEQNHSPKRLMNRTSTFPSNNNE